MQWPQARKTQDVQLMEMSCLDFTARALRAPLVHVARPACVARYPVVEFALPYVTVSKETKLVESAQLLVVGGPTIVLVAVWPDAGP